MILFWNDIERANTPQRLALIMHTRSHVIPGFYFRGPYNSGDYRDFIVLSKPPVNLSGLFRLFKPDSEGPGDLVPKQLLFSIVILRNKRHS